MWLNNKITIISKDGQGRFHGMPLDGLRLVWQVNKLMLNREENLLFFFKIYLYFLWKFRITSTRFPLAGLRIELWPDDLSQLSAKGVE